MPGTSSAGFVSTGISPVGSLISAVATPAQSTLSVSPQAVGNLLALAVETKFAIGQNYFCTGVTGGGVPASGESMWKRRIQLLPDAQGIHEITIWTGVVTTVGASTITATYSNAGTVSTTLNCQEFAPSTAARTGWSFDIGATASNLASITPTYPSLTPTQTIVGELYFGFIQWPGSGSATNGIPPGCVYQTDSNGNQIVYNVGVRASVLPIASSVSQVSSTAATLMRAVPISRIMPPGSKFTVSYLNNESPPRLLSLVASYISDFGGGQLWLTGQSGTIIIDQSQVVAVTSSIGSYSDPG